MLWPRSIILPRRVRLAALVLQVQRAAVVITHRRIHDQVQIRDQAITLVARRAHGVLIVDLLVALQYLEALAHRLAHIRLVVAHRAVVVVIHRAVHRAVHVLIHLAVALLVVHVAVTPQAVRRALAIVALRRVAVQAQAAAQVQVVAHANSIL